MISSIRKLKNYTKKKNSSSNKIYIITAGLDITNKAGESIIKTESEEDTMTREEAIKKLKDILEEATETDNSVCYVTSDDADVLKVAIQALEQEPCEDAVSRDCDKCAYYDDGANDEACDGCFADEYEHPNFKPKAPQHYDDAVSRQAVLDQAVDYGSNTYLIPVNSVKTLPSVTPKEKTGKWEVYEVVDFGDFKGTEKYKCSKCGEKVGVFKSNFCPNCGKRMVSE